jgi:glycosyltransferase A (GT-A) superfamily protein (DUF2064 family)
VVMAKSPQVGRVKTRLCPPFTRDEAADVARAALEDTLQVAVAAAGRTAPLLALSGPPGPWVPAGVEVIPQRGSGLDERIAAALDDAGGPAVVIGMDTPQVRPPLLRQALRAVRRRPSGAALGPAADGGWWVLALGRADPGAVLGVPMSRETTGAAQAERLHAKGYRVRPLPVLRDVDTVHDALAVAAIAPHGRFAATVRRIVASAPHRFAAQSAAVAEAPGARLLFHDGSAIDLPIRRWLGEALADEELVLDRAEGPVLDVGCGPGRYAAALLRCGVPALGIDPAPAAVALARRRGAVVLQRSVFDPLPRSGAWATALLLDGNIGIGGDPIRLLGRLQALLRPGGRALVEVDPPAAGLAGVAGRRARLEVRGMAGPWFRWSTVGAGTIPRLAFDAGFELQDVWEAGGRWFAQLRSERGVARSS